MERNSCKKSFPFINLGEDYDNAPRLNYNIPQESCLNFISTIPIPIPTMRFEPTFSDNVDPYWEGLRGKTASEIESFLKADLEAQVIGTRVIGNASELLNAAVPVVFVTNERPEDANGAASSNIYYNSGSGYMRVIAMTGSVSGNYFPDMVMLKEGIGIGTAKFTVSPFVVNAEKLANKVVSGFKPVVTMKANGIPEVKYIAKKEYTPAIYALLDLGVCSYLGNYGAGKTVSTFTLLPGEKTTITLRTFREMSDKKTSAMNWMEGNSKSASEQMQRILESEMGYESSSELNSSVGFGVDIGSSRSEVLAKIFGNKTANTSFYASNNANESFASVEHVLSSAISSSVVESNSYRDVAINGTTETTVTETEESVITRILENTNWSRTLNFVFRQLLQEYHVLTWVKNIRFVVTNGSANGTMVGNVWNLQSMLAQVISPAVLSETFDAVINHVCHVTNHQGTPFTMFEQQTLSSGGCVGSPVPENVWKNKANTDTWTSSTGESITVPGVILSGKTYVLKTDSVIVDSLLGQGEALDCYNARLQEAAAEAAELENQKTTSALAIVAEISDPEKKTEAYRKLFGKCCEDKNLNVGPLTLNVTSTNYDNQQP